MKYFFFFLTIPFCYSTLSYGGQWCKAIYPYSEEASDGKFNKQLSLCKNSDNLFISISAKYINSSQLLHASIANFCDLNRQVVKTSSQTGDESFNSVACVFKKHTLRKEKN
tara:strand:+ start:2502 stop:2834 length:333 start_codon:yes stop_codon:yes gene_type:complete